MAAAVVLILAGVWLSLQAIAGDLARRLYSWGKATAAGTVTVGGTPTPPDTGVRSA